MKTRPLRGLYAPELLESRIAPATFTVTSLLDNGTEGTLRDKILEANAAPGADTIVFKLTDPLLPHTITLTTATGEIPITEPLTIKGPGIDLLTISGSDLIRIFNINYTDPAILAPTTISGLTLTDGKAAGAGQDGGAILSAESLTLKNVVVTSSEAADDGGAVRVNTPGKVSIIGSRFADNKAAFAGGGLYIKASSLSIVKSTVSSNTSGSAAGGLYAQVSGSKSTITIDSSIFSGNTSTSSRAGGLFLEGNDDSKFLLKNSLITGNTASTAGGGLYFGSGNLLVTKTTFSGNIAKEGGALADAGAKSLTISGSRFLANQATGVAGAGGGALELTAAAAVKIAGTVFSGNTSAKDGGAITVTDATSVLNVAGSGFLGNTAANDGGAIVLHAKASLTLKGSVLSGNIAANDGGAIYADVGSSLTVLGNRFTENKATAIYGGAIAANGTGPTSVFMTLAGNLFQANIAGTYGGAISSVGDGAFSSKGDKVLGNVAGGDGGGLYLNLTGGIIITGSLFQGNVAGDDGGGMRINGTATLTGVKVLENVATTSGGGIFAEPGTDLIVISKSIITGNVAATGGGIFSTNANTTIPGTKVIGNSARSDPNTSGI